MDGINLVVEEFARLRIVNGVERGLASQLADEYAKKPEYKEMLDSIKIDRDEVHSLVMHTLIDRIIDNWVEKQYGNRI